MVKIKVLGTEIVIANPVPWQRRPGYTLKNYHFSESPAQAAQRLKLLNAAHALRDTYLGKKMFVMYRGVAIPKIAAEVAGKITGNTSGYSTRLDWYKAHRPSDSAIEASRARLTRIAGAIANLI
ncbi:MAG: hypothetical protein QXP38_00650 [Nitrososphaerota archaeon]